MVIQIIYNIAVSPHLESLLDVDSDTRFKDILRGFIAKLETFFTELCFSKFKVRQITFENTNKNERWIKVRQLTPFPVLPSIHRP